MDYEPDSYWNARKNPNKSDQALGWLLEYAAAHTVGQPRICGAIGTRADQAFLQDNLICFDLSRSDGLGCDTWQQATLREEA